MDIKELYIMSMASEVMKLIFAVLDVLFNRGQYTVIIKDSIVYIVYRPAVIVFHDCRILAEVLNYWTYRVCVKPV